MKQFGFTKDQLTFGALVGKATLVDVKRYASKLEFLNDGSKHLALEFFEDDEALIQKGKIHGFVLKDAMRLEKPIPYRGALNFFEVRLP